MKQRIVEETLANGEKQYKVEVKSWVLGWKTASIYDADKDMHFDAIFSTLDEALDFISSIKIVSRKIIEV